MKIPHIRFLAVLCGFLVMQVAAFVFGYLIGIVAARGGWDMGDRFAALVLIINPVSCFLGGYLAAKMVPPEVGVFHGVLVGLAVALIGIFPAIWTMTGHWDSNTIGQAIFQVLLVTVAAACGGHTASRVVSKRAQQTPDVA
jgi:hypothetical protein